MMTTLQFLLTDRDAWMVAAVFVAEVPLIAAFILMLSLWDTPDV